MKLRHLLNELIDEHKSLSWHDLFGKYREINPVVTAKDYYIASIANFENVSDKFDWDRNKLAVIQSPTSNSLYKIDIRRGLLYRRSDHWGNVGSCIWNIDREGGNGYQIGRVKFRDMKPNLNTERYIAHWPDAHKKAEIAISNLKYAIRNTTSKRELKDMNDRLNIYQRWLERINSQI